MMKERCKKSKTTSPSLVEVKWYCNVLSLHCRRPEKSKRYRSWAKTPLSHLYYHLTWCFMHNISGGEWYIWDREKARVVFFFASARQLTSSTARCRLQSALNSSYSMNKQHWVLRDRNHKCSCNRWNVLYFVKKFVLVQNILDWFRNKLYQGQNIWTARHRHWKIPASKYKSEALYFITVLHLVLTLSSPK